MTDSSFPFIHSAGSRCYCYASNSSQHAFVPLVKKTRIFWCQMGVGACRRHSDPQSTERESSERRYYPPNITPNRFYLCVFAWREVRWKVKGRNGFLIPAADWFGGISKQSRRFPREYLFCCCCCCCARKQNETKGTGAPVSLPGRTGPLVQCGVLAGSR